MGGMGAEVVFEVRESLVCKNPLNLLLELEENPLAERQDQTLHKTQSG